MDPRLLRYYNDELRHLREMGAEFAKQFPKIAARLGMEGLEVADPYVERLMEGFAFLAGRVQLKLDAEFPRFTQRMLDILYPQFLAPTPAMLIAQLRPELGDAALANGVDVPRGSVMHSHAGKAGSTTCEFRTSHDLTLWPLELTQVEYFTHAADLPMSAVPAWRKYRAGLRFRLRATAGVDFSQMAVNDLRVHCTGIDDIAYRIHELVCGHTLGVLIMPSQRSGQWHEALDGDCVEAAGFDDDQALLPATLSGFEGYRLLQEYFAFPQRFLFFDLVDIGAALRRHACEEVDIVILLSKADNSLQQAVDASCLALNCVPAINLLDRRCDRIHVEPGTSDFHIVPDRARPMDFEIHSVTQVLGYGTGAKNEWQFLPFYNAFHTESRSHTAYYSCQREPRLMSQTQQRDGPRTSYIGSEMFLSVVDAQEAPFPADLRQIGVQALSRASTSSRARRGPCPHCEKAAWPGNSSTSCRSIICRSPTPTQSTVRRRCGKSCASMRLVAMPAPSGRLTACDRSSCSLWCAGCPCRAPSPLAAALTCKLRWMTLPSREPAPTCWVASWNALWRATCHSMASPSCACIHPVAATS
jgi:type VI secretion system protein ImpG